MRRATYIFKAHECMTRDIPGVTMLWVVRRPSGNRHLAVEATRLIQPVNVEISIWARTAIRPSWGWGSLQQNSESTFLGFPTEQGT